VSKKSDRKNLTPENFYLKYDECQIDPTRGNKCEKLNMDNGVLRCTHAKNAPIEVLKPLCGVLWSPEVLEEELQS